MREDLRPLNTSSPEYHQNQTHSLSPIPPPVHGDLPSAAAGGEAQSSSLPNNASSTTTYPCQQCPKIFTKRYELNTHFKKHSRPFSCKVVGCSRAFQFKKDLTRHMQDIHSDDKLFCPYEECRTKLRRVGTARKATLDRHIKSVHQG